MISILNSLQGGGDEFDYGDSIDLTPYIENVYIVEYQDNGNIRKECFYVYDDDNYNDVFTKALNFARTHDVLVFYLQLCTEFYHPKTGERIETPVDAAYCKHYYDEPIMPYKIRQEGFEIIDPDELPF